MLITKNYDSISSLSSIELDTSDNLLYGYEHRKSPLINMFLNQSNEKNQSISKDFSGVLEISVIGLGYVGSVSCACFSSLGHNIIGVDADNEKVNAINRGCSTIVEPRLNPLLEHAHKNKKLMATTSIKDAVLSTNITLISVGTPSKENGSCNLTYLKNATKQIAQALAEKATYHLVVFRSTIPPTTTNEILIPLLSRYSHKKIGIDFGVCFNPEFLRESTAIDDFYRPSKTVIGVNDERSAKLASKLYSAIDDDIIITSIEAAEFVKYIDNTWHALKVSFGNEVGRICKSMNVDSHEVMNIFLQDKKLNISPYYLKPGFAFGGSCLPKDTRGIVYMAKQNHVNIPIIDHINQSNAFHIEHTMELINQLNVIRVGIVGLTFKSDTDDLRESPSLALLKKLLLAGYEVQFYDPCITAEKHLDSDPLMNKLLNEARSDCVSNLVEKSQAIVITHKKNYTKRIARTSPKDKHIIDVVHLENSLLNKANYHGLCW